MSFKTFPRQFEDILFWPIIRTVWEPFSFKRSHWWHWLNYDREPKYLLEIPINNQAATRHEGIKNNLIQTNFNWNQAAILKPKDYEGEYRCGFVGQEGHISKNQVCALILQGPVAVLLSPYQIKFFAESFPDKNPIELELFEVKSKYLLPKDVPLI